MDKTSRTAFLKSEWPKVNNAARKIKKEIEERRLARENAIHWLWKSPTRLANKNERNAS